jgi:hypothetical protein
MGSRLKTASLNELYNPNDIWHRIIRMVQVTGSHSHPWKITSVGPPPEYIRWSTSDPFERVFLGDVLYSEVSLTTLTKSVSSSRSRRSHLGDSRHLRWRFRKFNHMWPLIPQVTLRSLIALQGPWSCMEIMKYVSATFLVCEFAFRYYWMLGKHYNCLR